MPWERITIQCKGQGEPVFVRTDKISPSWLEGESRGGWSVIVGRRSGFVKGGKFSGWHLCEADRKRFVTEANALLGEAWTVPSAFLLSEIQQVEGETILIADCADYDAFQALPRVLHWEGRDFSLTGWNSDTHRACWKITNRIATIVGS